MLPLRVEINEDNSSIHINPIWAGVDRPNTGGWCVPNDAKGKKLAKRLAAAIMAGACAKFQKVSTDRNGKTYVSCGHEVIGRRINADLKRLGF